MGILVNNKEYNIDQLLNEKIVVTKRKRRTTTTHLPANFN